MALLRQPSGGGPGDPESRESTWKVMRLSITQDSQREAGRGWGHRLPRGGGECTLEVPICAEQQRNQWPHPEACAPQRPEGRASPPILPWRPGAFGAPWTQPPGRDPATPSPPPSSPSTGAERKVDPFAKYAKKEGRWFSLRKTRAGREPVLPVPTKMGSEIIRTSDLAGLR